MRFRPLPVMTACVVPALAVLVLLGHWQWQRYSEKLSYADSEISWQGFQGEKLSPAFLIYTLFDGRPGWRHVGLVDDGSDIFLFSETIYLDVEAPRLDLSAGGAIVFEEAVWVTPSGANAFTPAASGNLLFAYDVETVKGLAEPDLSARIRSEVIEPRLLTLVDLERGGRIEIVENPWANPALADPLPPSRHLGYALTWWGIGIGLVVIYFVFHIQSGRLTLKRAI